MEAQRHRIRRIAIGLALAGALGGVAPVAATEPAYVDIHGCWADGGSATVPAGADIVIYVNWWAAALGQIQAWLSGVRTTAEIDETPIVDADAYWGAPLQLERKFWITFWEYGLAPLHVDQSVTVDATWTLATPVWDGFTHYRSGLLLEATCTITATAG